MNKRETALNTIKLQYAQHGKETPSSMRAYVENRIGWAARRKAVSAGLEIFRADRREYENDIMIGDEKSEVHND